MDLVLRGGTVFDGEGSPGVKADVGILAGRIAAIGVLDSVADKPVLDVSGLAVSPGFIDIHTHADIALLARPRHEPKVMQGVTTEVFSNCGLGFAPVTPAARALQRDYLLGLFGDDTGVDWSWTSVREFLDHFRRGIATNAAYLIPHGAVRVSVMGMDDRPATAAELAQMEGMVRDGIAEGAWGLSTGLWYSPMSYAARDENLAVCRAAAREGGFFATHMRDYAEGILASLEETLEISAHSGAPAQVSHLQLGGPAAWKLVDDVLERLEQARASGIDVAYDAYPYTAGSTLIQALLPTWATAGGPSELLLRLHDAETRERVVTAMNAVQRDWSRHVLCGAHSAEFAPHDGRALSEIAAGEGMSIGELICRILVADELQAGFIAHLGDEGALRKILAHPLHMIGSDGLHLPGRTHPRLYGAFPRLLGHYVRETGLLRLEEAIHKMTGAPARRMGFADRGVLRTGAAADITVFDPATIRDTASFEDPCRYPEGILHVLVNGRLVVENGRHTGALAGEVLTRG